MKCQVCGVIVAQRSEKSFKNTKNTSFDPFFCWLGIAQGITVQMILKLKMPPFTISQVFLTSRLSGMSAPSPSWPPAPFGWGRNPGHIIASWRRGLFCRKRGLNPSPPACEAGAIYFCHHLAA